MNGSSISQQQQQQQQQPVPVSSPLVVGKNSSEHFSPAPQPPQRNHLRSSLVRNNTVSTQSPTNETNPLSPILSSKNMQNNNTQNTLLNNATSEATKLAHKSAGTGSVQSLNTPNQETLASQMQQNRNLSIPEKSILANHLSAHKTQIQDISGAISNKESRDELRKELSMDQASPLNRQHLVNSSVSPPSSNHFSSHSAINNTRLPNAHNSNLNSSSPVNNNGYSFLPWILLNGEDLVIGRDKDSAEIPIIFVLPDNRAINGKLYITNFRIYFRSSELYQTSSEHYGFIIIDLPLGLIHRIEKIGHQSSKHVNFYGLMISCKNGRRLRFAHTNDKNTRREIYDVLQKYAFPINHQLNFFAYSYKATFQDNNGWNVYDVYQEYGRMGITLKSSHDKQPSDWRFSMINSEFKFCETYPRVLVVPNLISDDKLREVGEFRSKHRIPVVSWIKYDTSCRAALLRSSQPMVGLKQRRNEADESYLHHIFKLNTSNCLDKLLIVDARPLVNAVANRGSGGGYENDDHYEKLEIQFVNIQNIHVMRESVRKVFEMGMPSHNASSNQHSAASSNAQSNSNNNNNNTLNDDKNYLVNLENSKWLEHVRLVLNGVLKIVRYISQNRASVLVHCSDGWDRTAQLTSLSMLMLDKYYRTIRGFEVLIEKEWLSFGHRFGIRMGHGSEKHSDQDRSPIFLQFIDACWQILQQNSKVFEFNEKLLLAIVQNMYTNQFGTFLYNNEYEREKHNVKSTTVSLWSYINSNINEFKNNAYVEYDGVVEFSSTYASLQLWTAYYFQYKETIDDNTTETFITNYNQINKSNYNLSAHPIASTSAVANPAGKINVQSFFQQMVNQMKRINVAQQEPELIRYRATVHSSE